MNRIDVLIIGVATFGLLLWIRGCRRNSIPDCGLGLALGVVGTSLYFFLFSLTRTAWLGAIIFTAFFAALLPFQRTIRSTGGRILALIVILMAASAAIAEHKYISTGNALLVIEPYRSGKGWAFDEARLGLRGEPFVQGIPEMINKLVAGIPGSDKSVRLIFSQRSFPGSQLKLDRRGEQDGGNWYHSSDLQTDGWLCPALFKFFPRAPQNIYIKAEPK